MSQRPFDIPPDISTLNLGGGGSNPWTSPEALAAILSGGLGMGQSFLQNRANSQQNAQDNQFTRQNLITQLMAGLGQDQSNDMLARQQAHMGTFNQNPLAQSQQMFSTAALGDLAQRGATRVGPGGVQNPFNVSQFTQGFMQPQALAENASRFYGAAGALNPTATAPDLSALGFGQAGADRQQGMQDEIGRSGTAITNLNAQRRGDLIDQLQQATQQQGGPAPEGYEYDKKTGQLKKKGGGFLGALGKIAGFAAPFAAMAIPGLQGVGIASMLGRAGVGAGMGALSSGLQGGSAVGGALQGGIGSATNDYFTRMRNR